MNLVKGLSIYDWRFFVFSQLQLCVTKTVSNTSNSSILTTSTPWRTCLAVDARTDLPSCGQCWGRPWSLMRCTRVTSPYWTFLVFPSDQATASAIPRNFWICRMKRPVDWEMFQYSCRYPSTGLTGHSWSAVRPCWTIRNRPPYFSYHEQICLTMECEKMLKFLFATEEFLFSQVLFIWSLQLWRTDGRTVIFFRFFIAHFSFVENWNLFFKLVRSTVRRIC